MPEDDDKMLALLDEAGAHHQQGDLARAETLYRQVLDLAREDADALHLLGMVYLQSQRAADAIPLLQRAIAADPEVAEFHNSLGNGLLAIGDKPAAAKAFADAVRVNGDYSEALYNLGFTLE